MALAGPLPFLSPTLTQRDLKDPRLSFTIQKAVGARAGSVEIQIVTLSSEEVALRSVALGVLSHCSRGYGTDPVDLLYRDAGTEREGAIPRESLT